MFLLGIRREDKNRYERRTPLTPEHVAALRRDHGVQVVLQPAPRRIFSDDEYRSAGASLAESLHACPLILGIKEMPLDTLLSCKAYLFFSHTIKGQPYNMPLLQRIMDLGCTLLDYEKITDEHGKRLLFFGRQAGLAGMIDSLWALGQRLSFEGLDTPLMRLQPAHCYDRLVDAKAEIEQLAPDLRAQSLPPELTPLTFGITGYGNVSGGVQEILDLLQVQEVAPADLHRVGPSDGPLVKVVFREEDLLQSINGAAFDLQDYYHNPGDYCSVFHRSLPQINVLLNCVYWDAQYPRLVTLEDLRELYGQPRPRLKIIGDISCDVQGSIEATVRATGPGNPVYVYDLQQDLAVDGVQGAGPVIMAVENLPAELPLSSSENFSRSLFPFIPSVLSANYSGDFESCDLPPPFKRSVIVYKGKLTPDFQYLSDHLRRSRDV